MSSGDHRPNGETVADFMARLQKRIATLRPDELIPIVGDPCRLVGKGSPEFLQLSVLEIAASHEDPRVTRVVASKLRSFKHIKAHPEDIHYRRLLNVALRLASSETAHGDAQTQSAALKMLTKLGKNTTAENRVAILSQFHSAIFQPPIRQQEDIAKQFAYVSDDWVEAGVELTKAEQDWVWKIFSDARELPDYQAAKCLKRVGHLFLLCPEYRDEFLAAFESIFNQDDAKGSLLRERVADEFDAIALAILTETRVHPARATEMKDRLTALIVRAAVGDEFVRKQLAHSVQSVKEIFPDLEELCDDIKGNLKEEHSEYIDIGLEIGSFRAQNPALRGIAQRASFSVSGIFDRPGEAILVKDIRSHVPER